MTAHVRAAALALAIGVGMNLGFVGPAAAQGVCRKLKLVTTSPGLFKLTTVEPADAGCRVTVRVLAFVPLKFTKKRLPATSPELDVVYHRLYGKNYELAKLVGRVCEYPFELLFQPAEEVKRVLDLRSGLRLMASSGWLRHKTKSLPEG